MLEVTFVRTIAEGFLVGEAAAANADSLAPTQAVWLALSIN
jgi:hypothetical protein